MLALAGTPHPGAVSMRLEPRERPERGKRAPAAIEAVDSAALSKQEPGPLLLAARARAAAEGWVPTMPHPGKRTQALAPGAAGAKRRRSAPARLPAPATARGGGGGGGGDGGGGGGGGGGGSSGRSLVSTDRSSDERGSTHPAAKGSVRVEILEEDPDLPGWTVCSPATCTLHACALHARCVHTACAPHLHRTYAAGGAASQQEQQPQVEDVPRTRWSA